MAFECRKKQGMVPKASRSVMEEAEARRAEAGATGTSWKNIVYLELIPGDDIRLFAQIELAAALAGLHELPGVQREYRPARDRSRRRLTRRVSSETSA
jgi:hypothetical protein